MIDGRTSICGMVNAIRRFRLCCAKTVSTSPVVSRRIVTRAWSRLAKTSREIGWVVITGCSLRAIPTKCS